MNYELIASYLAGECTKEEDREVTAWLAASPENEREFRRFKQLWQASRQHYEHYEPDMAKAWQRIKPVAEPLFVQTRQRPPSVFYWLQRVAAVVFLGLLIAGGVYTYQRFLDQVTDGMQQLTARGQRSRVLLSDGTVVWLNASSQLRYPKAFGDTQREVFLEGEAFFEVTKNPRKPFMIHSGPTLTRVLGTSFNVRAYASEEVVEVVVVTGKVAFSSLQQPNESVLLKPHEKAVWNTRADRITQATNDNPNFLAWKTDSLIFRDMALYQVLPTLEKHYGVPIQISNQALLSCRFTGTFTRARLEDILQVFAYGTELTYQKQQQGYLLTGKGCPSNQ